MAKSSPLAELHRSNGAEFGEEDGWLLPRHFGDPLQEYQAVRSGVGLLDLCHRALLRFTGADRVSFLHGMVSNDVKGLATGEGIYATFLDIKGKVLADARVFCASEILLVDLWEPLKEKILAHLSRYLIADDVEIADLTGQYGILSLQGPKAGLFLDQFLSPGEIPLKELNHCTVSLGGAEVRLARCRRTGEEGFDLLVKTGELLPVIARLEERGGERGFSLRWIGTQAQETLRVEAGIPRYGADIDEDNLLLEAGLDQAVSFQKGCYLGQEVLERIRSRGHINKKLVGMVLEGKKVARRNDTIHAGEKEIGRVTSSIFSPALRRPLALGYIHCDYIQPGTPVTIIHDGETTSAVVSALPFYGPSL